MYSTAAAISALHRRCALRREKRNASTFRFDNRVYPKCTRLYSKSNCTIQSTFGWRNGEQNGEERLIESDATRRERAAAPHAAIAALLLHGAVERDAATQREAARRGAARRNELSIYHTGALVVHFGRRSRAQRVE